MIKTIEECKTRKGFNVKLEGKIQMNQLIGSLGVVCWTPIACVMNYKGYDIVVHIHGELHFRNCLDINKVKELTEEMIIEKKLVFLPGSVKQL